MKKNLWKNLGQCPLVLTRVCLYPFPVGSLAWFSFMSTHTLPVFAQAQACDWHGDRDIVGRAETGMRGSVKQRECTCMDMGIPGYMDLGSIYASVQFHPWTSFYMLRWIIVLSYHCIIPLSASAETLFWGLLQLLLFCHLLLLEYLIMAIRQERNHSLFKWLKLTQFLIALNILLLISCSFLTTRCMDSTWASAFTYS